MDRDEFGQATKNVLSRRVGNKCSNPNCRKLTSGPHTESGKALNIGVAAHISAAAPGGPRYDSALTSEQRKSPDNGIWLCQNCAKMIDSDEDKHTVSVLLEWKGLSEEVARREIENQRVGYTLIQTPEKQIKIALEALDRIRKEKRNFERIIAGTEYNSPIHKKAVTEFSFELTLQAMLRLRRVYEFESAALDLLHHLKNRDAKNTLERILELEIRLDDYCDR